MYFRDCSDTIRETPEFEPHLRARNEVIASFKTFEGMILGKIPYSSEKAVPAVLPMLLNPSTPTWGDREQRQQQLELPQYNDDFQLLI